MKNNLKKRFYTSIILFFFLFMMLISNYALTYFLMISGIFSVLEFFKIILIIFNKNKKKQLLYNTLFTVYIFCFCTLFIIFTSFIHLKILTFVILLTCIFSDIGGFIFGKIFKGPKLTKISPNKTFSGAIGSIIFSSFIISFIFFYINGNFEFSIILIGFLTSVGCQLGDLFISFLKIKSLLKNTGNFLPGHGGVLDRVDGILLGVPIGFLSLLLIY